ncbi:3'-5' exonuclease [Shewanella colwelliana]|uniref:3'-5' exonuclease n=1 Tax=Shewanella colwelliana TaxID=23 RepID=A0ABQ4NXJ3_SHECO|nr:3'-5' exonuclease [Shewanella colwelliana]MCZ4338392.1 3'-5' exonuclease [Shewanella colwelliana]MDX1281382.1 3'-5' exonuclease [Shewanella colwelliana]GIU17229.1 3'-5' exonuclease [Shewanella colwelliana]GIU39263.1 3'-5' exonuclease [Shewanella colwelliana]
MLKKLLSPPTIDWQGKFQQKLKVITHKVLRDYYATPLPLGNTPIGEVEFLAMDFETTGLNPDKDDIISIGTVPFNLQRIFINRAQSWTVRPREKLAEESVIIHGITHTDILDAPDLSAIFEQVLQEMAGKIIVVHCHQIERQFFETALMARINKGIEFPVVDTMALESSIQRQQYGGVWNRLKGTKPQSIRLGSSRHRYGLPAYSPHHALTDAIATAELLQAQIAHHYKATSAIDNFWQ